MAATVTINDDILNRINADLSRMEAVHRLPAVKQGVRRGGEIVEKRTYTKLPAPGYPGDKRGKKPLRETLKTLVKDYPSSKVVAITGYAVPAGAHGHPVEEGHDIVTGGTKAKPSAGRKSPRSSKRGLTGMGTVAGRVEGRHDLANAASETTQAQFAAVEAGVREALPSA